MQEHWSLFPRKTLKGALKSAEILLCELKTQLSYAPLQEIHDVTPNLLLTNQYTNNPTSHSPQQSFKFQFSILNFQISNFNSQF